MSLVIETSLVLIETVHSIYESICLFFCMFKSNCQCQQLYWMYCLLLSLVAHSQRHIGCQCTCTTIWFYAWHSSLCFTHIMWPDSLFLVPVQREGVSTATHETEVDGYPSGLVACSSQRPNISLNIFNFSLIANSFFSDIAMHTHVVTLTLSNRYFQAAV